MNEFKRERFENQNNVKVVMKEDQRTGEVRRVKETLGIEFIICVDDETEGNRN